MYECVEHRHLSEVEDTWGKLYSSNPLLSPYQSYEFCKTVAEDYRLSHLRLLLTIRVFEIRLDGVPIMLIPLWRKPLLKAPFTEYYLYPDFCLAGYLDFIYDPTCTDQDFERAIELVKTRTNRPITIRRLPEDSLLCHYLVNRMEPYGTAPSALISFHEGSDSWFSSLGKQTRQNVRTARNRMTRDGREWRLDVFDQPYFDDALWNDVLRIHLKRKRLRDNISESGLRNYVERNHDPMERAIRSMPQHRLFLLSIDGQGAAYFTSFLSNDGKRLVTPRLAIDDDFKFYSPGIVLITEAIKHCCDQTEIRELDLCHGDQGYKYTMGAVTRTNHYFTI